MKYIVAFTFSLMCLLGLAQDREYSKKIGEFTEFTVADNINVIYKTSTDSAGYVSFTAPPEVAPAITFSCKNEKLKIELIHDKPIAKVPTVTVYSMALKKVTNWGDSTVTIASNTPGVEFKAEVIGNGDVIVPTVHCTKVEASVKAGNGHIFLGGKAQSAKYVIMSAGAIEAGNLEAANVKASMLGTGNIDCYATEGLSVVGMGSGHVYYKGSPSIKNRSVGVKVEHID